MTCRPDQAWTYTYGGRGGWISAFQAGAIAGAIAGAKESVGPHSLRGKVSLAAAWLCEGEEREGRWSREGPEYQAEGQVLLQRQGPGINTHCHRPGWDGVTTSCLGLLQRRDLVPAKKAGRAWKLQRGIPVPFPLRFFQVY